MASIIVAVACNLIAALILVSGILSTVKSGIRVAGLRLFLTIAGGVGAFFLTPVISNALLVVVVKAATETTEAILISNVISELSISVAAFNSVIFLIVFFAFYLFGTMFCNIAKHIFIKGVREGSINKARLKRAKSINAKAEKIARKTEWKEMKAEYKEGLTWWQKLISALMGVISAIIAGFVVIMSFGFVAKDLANANNDRQFLVDGYKYTLNGLIEDKIEFDFDGWLVGAEEKSEEPEEQPCEHSFVEGVCEHCGEAEIPAVE